MGIVRSASSRFVCLTLVQNVAFNIANKATTMDLMETLSNIYEKPSASNIIFDASSFQSKNGRGCFCDKPHQRIQRNHDSVEFGGNQIR